MSCYRSIQNIFAYNIVTFRLLLLYKLKKDNIKFIVEFYKKNSLKNSQQSKMPCYPNVICNMNGNRSHKITYKLSLYNSICLIFSQLSNFEVIESYRNVIYNLNRKRSHKRTDKLSLYNNICLIFSQFDKNFEIIEIVVSEILIKTGLIKESLTKLLQQFLFNIFSIIEFWSYRKYCSYRKITIYWKLK